MTELLRQVVMALVLRNRVDAAVLLVALVVFAALLVLYLARFDRMIIIDAPASTPIPVSKVV